MNTKTGAIMATPEGQVPIDHVPLPFRSAPLAAGSSVRSIARGIRRLIRKAQGLKWDPKRQAPGKQERPGVLRRAWPQSEAKVAEQGIFLGKTQYVRLTNGMLCRI